MRDFVLFVLCLGLFLGPAAFAFRRAKSELALHEQISMPTFIAAFFGYMALAFSVLLSSWLNAWPVPIMRWVSRALGLTLLLVGALMYLTARLQMRSIRQTWALRADKLLTTGIYSLLRHPQNLGWGFLLFGIALLGRSGVALALTGVYVLSCLIWLPVEEKFLERRFGTKHVRYRSQKRRLGRLFSEEK
jgi:protein-S-isoprenylcysteine O-methyltransferase Ste14